MDGVYLKAGLEKQRAALPVTIGARATATGGAGGEQRELGIDGVVERLAARRAGVGRAAQDRLSTCAAHPSLRSAPPTSCCATPKARGGVSWRPTRPSTCTSGPRGPWAPGSSGQRHAAGRGAEGRPQHHSVPAGPRPRGAIGLRCATCRRVLRDGELLRRWFEAVKASQVQGPRIALIGASSNTRVSLRPLLTSSAGARLHLHSRPGHCRARHRKIAGASCHSR